MSTAATVYCIPPFCIAQCSMGLLGSVVTVGLEKPGHVLEFGDDAK